MRHRTSERASQNDGKIMIKANSDWTLTHFWLFGPPPQWSHLTRPHWFRNFRPDQKMMIDCQHFETGIESETTKHENDGRPNWSILLMVNHLISRIQHHLKMLASRQNRQFVFNENNINKNNMQPFFKQQVMLKNRWKANRANRANRTSLWRNWGLGLFFYWHRRSNSNTQTTSFISNQISQTPTQVAIFIEGFSRWAKLDQKF